MTENSIATPSNPIPSPLSAGAVYSMTNATDGNTIMAYDRAADGALSHRAAYPTGGLGSGATTQPVDALGSQGAMLLDTERRLLFAVNAGSNEVSVFRESDTELNLLHKVDSGGLFPASLTLHGDLLYVLNSGGDGNITGFRVAEDGTLTPMQGSTRSLGAGGTHPPNIFRSPGQVEFSPAGDRLVLTHKAGNSVLVFQLDADGLPSAEPTTSLSAGRAPFGFLFDEQGHLLVVEVFGSGTPMGGAVSSYVLQADGTAQTLSASVANGQGATCWIAKGPGAYAYTTNQDGHTMSAYRVAEDGTLSLVNGIAARLGTNAFPADLRLTADGRFLYTLNAGTGTIAMFRTEENGALTSLGQINGLPAFDGAHGMVVR